MTHVASPTSRRISMKARGGLRSDGVGLRMKESEKYKLGFRRDACWTVGDTLPLKAPWRTKAQNTQRLPRRASRKFLFNIQFISTLMPFDLVVKTLYWDGIFFIF